MTTLTTRPRRVSLVARVLPPGIVGSGRARRVVERNVLVYRRGWLIIVSGFFEPVFYLLSIGVGIGKLVGDITGPGGEPIDYTAFVAPAMLASSAMNGAVYDSTMNVFFKLKYAHTYDGMIATPMTAGDVARGEITWALIRGALYAAMFCVVMLVMDLYLSWWGVLALPAAVLISFAFAATGLACTTFMKSWQDFEFVNLALLPLFLFSATFYPLDTYPPSIRWLVEWTPLSQGVVLVRGLTTGVIGTDLMVAAVYLAVMGTIGLTVASRRMEKLLLR
jgi:lipooligosaccharide transport system permease protein